MKNAIFVHNGMTFRIIDQFSIDQSWLCECLDTGIPYHYSNATIQRLLNKQ
jgi:hypothetical protein